MKDLSGWRFEAVYDNGGRMTTYANSADDAGARAADVATDGRVVTITLTRILPNGDLAKVTER